MHRIGFHLADTCINAWFPVKPEVSLFSSEWRPALGLTQPFVWRICGLYTQGQSSLGLAPITCIYLAS
jgi:hypothetical protein